MTLLTEQRFVRSEQDVREAGLAALIQSLGCADAIRFVTQLSVGQGDYLKWQDRAFEMASVDDLYEQAKKHWESRRT